ncbi:CDK5 regulatory subunit-associated protein 1-like 1 [Tupaia chinensis]|uniref:CDK5 regulatory subunit-associated protein 1-like 1 n=1 Tax=Tupaia chinensis TaxID=246437 RepID=L9L0L1_TUPCH|nr:CDK5 regulatory subunit-associated protein 1-like 1 [Tupaia chinensis]
MKASCSAGSGPSESKSVVWEGAVSLQHPPVTSASPSETRQLLGSAGKPLRLAVETGRAPDMRRGLRTRFSLHQQHPSVVNSIFTVWVCVCAYVEECGYFQALSVTAVERYAVGFDTVTIGERQQVLVTEESFDSKFYVAHNRFYEQVLVPKNASFMGKMVEVDIYESGKHFMKGQPVADARVYVPSISPPLAKGEVSGVTKPGERHLQAEVAEALRYGGDKRQPLPAPAPGPAGILVDNFWKRAPFYTAENSEIGLAITQVQYPTPLLQLSATQQVPEEGCQCPGYARTVHSG